MDDGVGRWRWTMALEDGVGGRSWSLTSQEEVRPAPGVECAQGEADEDDGGGKESSHNDAVEEREKGQNDTIFMSQEKVLHCWIDCWKEVLTLG